MTRWLQDKPSELAEELRIACGSDLRERSSADRVRALMGGAADLIDREIMGSPRLPLHWSFRDRLRDAWLCLRGRVLVLRWAERPLDYRFERATPLIPTDRVCQPLEGK